MMVDLTMFYAWASSCGNPVVVAVGLEEDQDIRDCEGESILSGS